MKILPLDEAECSSWGGGSTAELLILPAGSSYSERNFDYRISLASIDQPGSAFTSLPGIDRLITGLDGILDLEVNGKPVSLWQGQVLAFRGEDAVFSRSAGRDLNLMMRRGKPGRVFWTQGELTGPLYVFDPGQEIFYELEAGEAFSFGRVAVFDLAPITLPPQLQEAVKGMQMQSIGTGLSSARVLRFTDSEKTYYLKSDHSHRLKEEAAILHWLQGKLPVPQIILDLPGHLLMTAVPGRPAFSQDLSALLEALFDGLHQLRSVPLADCPQDRSIAQQLERALHRLEIGQVDLRVKDPWKIFRWLQDNQPAEEPCFIHGDYCLPNVYIAGKKSVGFIDLGSAGSGSAWNDLALCYRSFMKNYPQANRELFAAVWTAPLDWDLIHYYIQLDELA